jgi:hypothetical protein
MPITHDNIIPVLAQDIYEKLNSVPSLAGKVGLTTGGKQHDPSLANMPLPGAWAVLTSLTAAGPKPPIVPKTQAMQCGFSVMLFVAYGLQSDLVANQYPIISKVIAAVSGQEAPTGVRWCFEDMKAILINPDRLGYELRFSITTNL